MMIPKPTRNANIAQFSREKLAQIGLLKFLIRCGENMFFFWQTLFLRTQVPVHRDVCVIFCARTKKRCCKPMTYEIP